MSNYIIWNGVNSNTIDGLLIQNLPPFTKPKERIINTVIEGKDGDINEFIGYEPVDKIIKIGLYGNFDINKIIKFFSGSGKIIFSNEPDKFYYSKIIEYVDYNRLIKFREADINLHTQPFKYLESEVNTEVDVSTQTQITITNQGLENSKPILTIYGTGTPIFTLSNATTPTPTPSFSLDFTNDEYLTVDSMIEDCYKDTQTNLKNRSMSGSFISLNPGDNTLSWDSGGTVTKIIYIANSCWI